MKRFFKILWKLTKWIFVLLVVLAITWVVLFELGFCFKEYKFLTPQDLKDRNVHIGLEKSMVSFVNMNKEAPTLTFEMVEEYRKKHPDSFYVKRVNNEFGTFETGILYFYPPDIVVQNAKDKNLFRSEIITGVTLVRSYLMCGELEDELITDDSDVVLSLDDSIDKKNNPYTKIIKEKLQGKEK